MYRMKKYEDLLDMVDTLIDILKRYYLNLLNLWKKLSLCINRLTLLAMISV